MRSPVWALGATQIVGYGSLYYAFTVLAPFIAADIGMPREWVYGALSATLLASGLFAPLAGRWIDRFGARAVMAAGSVGAALALVLLAVLPGVAGFVASLVLVELVSTLVLYDAAFAALVQADASAARRSITHLTLIAGFASTLAWPATGLLVAVLSWREVYLVYAALNLLVCLPLHLTLGRPRAAPVPAEGPNPATVLAPALARLALPLMVAAFAAGGFVLSSMLIHIVPLLQALGLGAASYGVSALFGPAQVASRAAESMLGRGLHPLRVALLSAAMLPASLLVLAFGGGTLISACLFAVLFGLASGLISIVRGTLPLALFGPAGYAARLGTATAARLFVSSFAPFVFALGVERLGAGTALVLTAAVGASGVAAFLLLGRIIDKA